MKTKFLIPLFICWLGCFSLQAQDTDKKKIIALFEKVENVYENLDSYYLETDFKMYESPRSETVKESYKGLLIKKGKKTYMKIATAEFLYFPSLYVKIDNESKRMRVSKKIQKEVQQNPIALKSYLDYFSDFTLESVNNQWVCTLKTGKITFVPYSKVIVCIDKSTNRILNQKMYFLTKYKTKVINGKQQYDSPRLEVTYNNFKTSGFETAAYMDTNNYITVSKDKYKPAKKYRTYTIVD